MFISKIIEIENYRNLSNNKFVFDKNLNFIVGDNNIGKTNMIELLDKLINKGKFFEDDFLDIKIPINVKFVIGYSDHEIGFFEDNFDIDNGNEITVIAIQDSIDDRIEYSHSGSNTKINFKTIKMLNFIYYSSLRNPNKEIDFKKNTGTGKVLNYLLKKSLAEREIDQSELLDVIEIGNIVENVNQKIKKLNGLGNENIKVFINNDKEHIINRILEVGDSNNRNLMKLGDGLQYSFNIFLYILDLLIYLENTKENFDSLILTNENEEKLIPLIIGLDEPEIHQHPYRQRALIKSIEKIMRNENQDFKTLIKDLFGIDGFIGQVFIVTHSPNILSNDYKQIVRLYMKDERLKVKCGQEIEFDGKVHKHLMRSFIYIKEAMFSRKVLLVEGDSEFGAVPVFVKKLGYDIDEESIGVIKLDGADGVKRCMELYNSFGIDCLAIIDRDKEETYSDLEGVTFTKGIDFEEDVYDMFTFNSYLEYLIEIDKYKYLAGILKKKIDSFNVIEFLEKPEENNISINIGNQIMSEIKELELVELQRNKNPITGALLAEYLDEVPSSFEAIILQAVERS